LRLPTKIGGQPGEYITHKLKSSYRSFEESFRILLEKAKAGPVSLKTVLTILYGKGRILLLIFLSLGFGQIPIAAIFLGFLITYLGLRIAIGRNFIWMPKFLLYKKIPSYFLIKIIKQILQLLKLMKRWSYQRFLWNSHRRLTRIVTGLMIALVGVSFTISPPIPFSSFVAFVAIFLIAIGLLNDDDVYLIIGYIFTLFYFALVLFLLKFCSLSQLVDGVKYGVAYFSS
jgi:hypothetical protein